MISCVNPKGDYRIECITLVKNKTKYRKTDLQSRLLRIYLANFTSQPTFHEMIISLEFFGELIIMFHVICFHSLVLGFDVCTIWSGNIMQFYIFLFSKTWNFLWIVYLIFDHIFQLGLCEHICPCHAIYVDTRICMNWCSPPTTLVLWIKLKLSGIERRK